MLYHDDWPIWPTIRDTARWTLENRIETENTETSSSSRQDKRAECRQWPRERLVSPASRGKKDYRGFRGNGQRSVTMAVCFLAAATPFSFTGSGKYLRATGEHCIAQKTQFPPHRGTLLPLKENSISPAKFKNQCDIPLNFVLSSRRCAWIHVPFAVSRRFDTPTRDSPLTRRKNWHAIFSVPWNHTTFS